MGWGLVFNGRGFSASSTSALIHIRSLQEISKATMKSSLRPSLRQHLSVYCLPSDSEYRVQNSFSRRPVQIFLSSRSAVQISSPSRPLPITSSRFPVQILSSTFLQTRPFPAPFPASPNERSGLRISSAEAAGQRAPFPFRRDRIGGTNYKNGNQLQIELRIQNLDNASTLRQKSSRGESLECVQAKSELQNGASGESPAAENSAAGQQKKSDGGIVVEQDVTLLARYKTPYNFVTVLEVSRSADSVVAGARVLLLDKPGNVHSVYHKYRVLTESYYDILAALPAVIPDGPVGILGLGAGTAARLIHHFWPRVEMHGWELDVGVIQAARKYFDLEEIEWKEGNGVIITPEAERAEGRVDSQKEFAGGRPITEGEVSGAKGEVPRGRSTMEGGVSGAEGKVSRGSLFTEEVPRGRPSNVGEVSGAEGDVPRGRSITEDGPSGRFSPEVEVSGGRLVVREEGEVPRGRFTTGETPRGKLITEEEVSGGRLNEEEEEEEVSTGRKNAGGEEVSGPAMRQRNSTGSYGLWDDERDEVKMSLFRGVRENPGRLRVYVGDALHPDVKVDGGFAGLIVDLFAEGAVIPALQQVETWRQLREKLRPGGRIIVNCGGSCVEAEEKKDGGITMRETIAALAETFPGELSITRLHDVSDNSVALTGPPPDFQLWNNTLPECLRRGMEGWRPFEKS